MPKAKEEKPARAGKVLDLMPLLKKSLAESAQGSSRKKSAASGRRAPRRSAHP